jgi:hypothetical protein
MVVRQIALDDWGTDWLVLQAMSHSSISTAHWKVFEAPGIDGRYKLIFRMRPFVPTSHPALGLARATAQ